MGLEGRETMRLRMSALRTICGLGIGLLAVFAAASCAATKQVRAADSDRLALKMQHQILFRHGAESHVFEGYMILKKEAFFVKAFAGPGVDLFTLAREGAWHREELHIASLADKIDLKLVSDSSERIIPLRHFYLDYKKLDRKPNELIQWLRFPRTQKSDLFNFEKISKRVHLDIASVNSAMQISVSENKIVTVYVSYIANIMTK